MKVRMYVLVVAAAAAAYACSGGDNVDIDGGADASSDAPSVDGGNDKDGSTTADGAAGDGAITDGAVGDGAVTDGAAGDGGAAFACGNKTCNSATDYCDITKIGPDGGPKVDGGSNVDTCLAYPVTCTADGGKPSCACISTTCACAQSGSDITVTCP
jgi:hypothetical protein